jgi:ATP dependent DNA ligase-like protein
MNGNRGMGFGKGTSYRPVITRGPPPASHSFNDPARTTSNTAVVSTSESSPTFFTVTSINDPYLERRARLAEAITPSPRLRLATAEQVGEEAALEATFEQAVAEGCEGVICKSVAPTASYQAGARGWQWIKLKRDYRSELTDTLDLVVVVGGLAGRGRRAGMYGALLLAVYDPTGERFQTICKCGTGFSDAELAALPARLAPLARAQHPAEVDSLWAADVWFEPTPTTPPAGACSRGRGPGPAVPPVHRPLA